jgi:iron(III) transport system permease protein
MTVAGVSALAAIPGAAVVLIGLPVLALVRTALELDPAQIADALAASAGPAAVTLETAVAGAVFAVGGGTFLAFATQRFAVPGRRLLIAAAVLPLLVPGYVAALGWVQAFGPGGYVSHAFGFAVPALFGPLGIALVLGVEAAPLAYLVVVAALASGADADLERAARASGASPWTCFRTITLPLLAPVLGAALLICGVVSATAFGTPAVLGSSSGTVTVTTRIYQDLAFSSSPVAFARAVLLSLLLAAGVVVAVIASARLLGRRSLQFALPAGREHSRTRSGAWLVGAVGWLLIVLFVVVPLISLALTALTRAVGLPPVPSNWTLDNIRAAFDANFVAALGNSLLLSIVAATGVVLLGLASAAASRGVRRAGGLLAMVVLLSFAIPGTTFAVGVLQAYLPQIGGSLLIILVAYLGKFWALGERPIAITLDRISRDAVRAGRVSGAGAWTVARTIVLPLARPQILAAWLIVFLFGLHEITMSSLLYGPGNATLAVVVLDQQQLGDPSITAATALLVTGLVLIAALPLAIRAMRRQGTASPATIRLLKPAAAA